MIPWGLLETNPSLVVLIPFVWLLWQFYAPPILDRLVGYKPDSPEHLYDTRVTKQLRTIFSQVDRVDQRIDSIGEDVERVADTQEDLVNITLAQTHHMNGHDGKIDVEEVEKRLIDEGRDTPHDFLRDDDRSSANRPSSQTTNDDSATERWVDESRDDGSHDSEAA